MSINPLVTPLVTVVTPCLNPGARLARCLESVRDQTHTRVEHVVVDGGSSDRTVDLLKRSGVRWISELDRGQTDALNKGFRLARGELIGWLNSDDALEPEAIASVVESLSRSPHAGWAYGDCRIVEPGRPPRLLNPERVIGPESFYDANPVFQPGTFLDRAVLDLLGGVDEAFQLAMDFDLWLRLADAGFLGVYVPRTLATFEIHETSKSGALPWSAFLREEALALWRSGRHRLAEAKLGEASADASRAGRAVQRSALEHEVSAAVAWAKAEGIVVCRREVHGWAALMASRLERRDGVHVRHLRHVGKAAPWLAHGPRQIILAGLARRIRRG